MESNNNEEKKEFTFIKEKIKDKPLKKKRIAVLTLIIAMMGLVFGVVAAVAYIVGVRHLEGYIYPVKVEEVHIEEESEDVIVSEDESELETEVDESEDKAPVINNINNIVERVDLNLSDFESLYASLFAISKEGSKSIVQVAGVESDTDWFSNIYENQTKGAGLVIANNRKELLILAERDIISDAQQVEVTFPNGFVAGATEKKYDPNTNLCIISVPVDQISDEALESISMAVLGTSASSSIMGKNVIAIGAPLGTDNSISYGVITSASEKISMQDYDVNVLTTDIYGSDSGSGVLINLNGEVVGIITHNHEDEDAPNILKAYGISDLKNTIEKMSNGRDRAYLGIYGTDVTEQAMNNLGIPAGAYVTEVAMESPAMEGGIQNGDVIRMLGTNEIKSYVDYKNAINKSQPGDETVITISRYSRGEYIDMSFDVTLGKLE